MSGLWTCLQIQVTMSQSLPVFTAEHGRRDPPFKIITVIESTRARVLKEIACASYVGAGRLKATAMLVQHHLRAELENHFRSMGWTRDLSKRETDRGTTTAVIVVHCRVLCEHAAGHQTARFKDKSGPRLREFSGCFWPFFPKITVYNA
jgi:hypothetical protein